MSKYENTFKKILQEDGSNYIPTAPNTSGSGGVFGNAPSIGAPGSATGTPGTETYATGDARSPVSLFGGVVTRRGLNKKRKRKNKK